MAWRATGLIGYLERLPQLLRRFDDLVRSQATRTDSDAFDAAINDGFNALNVGLESPSRDIVCMTDVSSNGRSFSANIATLRHCRPV